MDKQMVFDLPAYTNLNIQLFVNTTNYCISIFLCSLNDIKNLRKMYPSILFSSDFIDMKLVQLLGGLFSAFGML